MELKTKYQYTYFIYPYAIKESKYTKYLLKLLKDENCKLRIFRKDKDLNLYSYFSHRARNYMFSSFNLSKTKLAKLEELPLDTKAAILAKNPCTIFEYTIQKDIQGKIIIEPKYNLENNLKIDFISKWHLGEDLNMNYYCEK